MENFTQVITQLFVAVLSVTGGIFLISCLAESLSSKNKMTQKGLKGLYIVINMDEIGEDVEFYIRKLQNDMAGNRIFTVNKIILYSKRQTSENAETEKICNILAGDYGNIVYMKDNLTDEILNMT